MSSGEIHLKNWKIAGMIFIPISIFCGIFAEMNFQGIGINIFLGLILGFALGRYIDPDADQIVITGAESRMIKELWFIGGPILFILSQFYGIAFRKCHRSFITHFPGVSTFIRMIFFFFWWLTILYWRGIIVYEGWQGITMFGIWVGLSFADFIHWAADILSSETKHNRNMR